ncbi:MAG: TIGR03000 domain-containing protein [Gemmataceae bacterium]|nr:TIGR03000 domain-containing protein [Gemmataceae bacterium]MCI0739745.1 TIGR03000 domain-containing protein [Gemmataceae bacterium]
MYGVILMAAMSTAPSAEGTCFMQMFRGHGCSGCHGWSGRHGCSGCYGNGYNGYNCNGWGYMTYAGNLCSGCFGCHGCYGWGHFAGYGHPSFNVYTLNYFGCYGCYGCYGGWACYGAPLAHHGWIPDTQGKDPERKSTEPEVTPAPKEKKKKLDTQARVIVEVPADAKLFIDDQPTIATSTRRVFHTPDLSADRTYFYDLKAEVVRNGQTIVRTQRVMLRAGQDTVATFAGMDNPGVRTAQTSAP